MRFLLFQGYSICQDTSKKWTLQFNEGMRVMGSVVRMSACRLCLSHHRRSWVIKNNGQGDWQRWHLKKKLNLFFANFIHVLSMHDSLPSLTLPLPLLTSLLPVVVKHSCLLYFETHWVQSGSSVWLWLRIVLLEPGGHLSSWTNGDNNYLSQNPLANTLSAGIRAPWAPPWSTAHCWGAYHLGYTLFCQNWSLMLLLETLTVEGVLVSFSSLPYYYKRKNHHSRALHKSNKVNIYKLPNMKLCGLWTVANYSVANDSQLIRQMTKYRVPWWVRLQEKAVKRDLWF